MVTFQVEKKSKERKLHLICLIRQYLHDEGFLDSAASLMNEMPMCKYYRVCDNIDLTTILQEYETYYQIRFQKFPKICKKVTEFDCNSGIPDSQKKKTYGRPHSSHTKSSDNLLHKNGEADGLKEGVRKGLSLVKVNSFPMSDAESNSGLDLGLKVLPLGLGLNNSGSKEAEGLLKSLDLCDEGSRTYKEMTQEFSKDIRYENPNVYWNDIIGHEDAKRILKEAIVYPIRYPEFFSGILGPWKGLLLYGPPGTGKSLLARAVATECKTTVISVSPSDISSKWRGESEKLIKAVFDLARRNAPSIILVEELDSLASRRDSALEHEASRRMKTELLLQMDKLVQHNDSIKEDKIFFMATSNMPWEVDPAMLRRIEKRVLVSLPTFPERQLLFEYFLPPNMRKEWKGPSLSCQLKYSELAEASEGYSGSDVKLVCKETIMEKMRGIFSELEKLGGANLKAMHLEKITNKDVMTALLRTKPSAALESSRYNKWNDEYGSS
ncbi:katanin p60 ATPase-containing subunit A-like 2 [Hetaerina americana]|uniref:katanin p60 ATPase-containing subunit A-like 2 n=1 Tax=Hetaerina americana TaxID=62018 RepID=UPI003A7F5691